MSQLTVVVPGLRWPDSGDGEYLSPQLNTPWLEQLLNFASVGRCDFTYSDFYYSWLFKEQPTEQTASLAFAYANRLGICDKWSNYLLASPTHLRIDRDRILIGESELLQLDFSESQQLIELLNQHFSGECEFFYISDELWLVGVTIDTSELELVPLIDIIGENINEFLPAGEAGLAVNALANESQMLFYECAVNNLRNQDGLLAVNGLWLWDKRNLIKNLSATKIISSNPAIGHPINDIKLQLSENQVVLIDQLYYPSRYRDAYAWVSLLNSLDQDLFYQLYQQWSAGAIKQISVIIPQFSGSRNGVEFRLSRLRFWQRYFKRRKPKVLNYIFN